MRGVLKASNKVIPLPLGEGKGEGLTVVHTLPLIPLPKGKGKMKPNPMHWYVLELERSVICPDVSLFLN
jgi:hypothetical protein